eukprot:scaffold66914_cov33-Attheya_sp.AAC.4
MNTTLGHMNQTRQGLRSTKRNISDDNTTPGTDTNTRTNLVFFAIIDPEEDPTGNTSVEDFRSFRHKDTDIFLYCTTMIVMLS